MKSQNSPPPDLLTFKENCPDIRNSKVIDIINELAEYKIQPFVYDPIADMEEARREHGIEFISPQNINDMDAVIIAVAHDAFLHMPLSEFDQFFKAVDNEHKVIIDVKGIFEREEIESKKYQYWRL